jgi:hypothetical protein
MALPEGVRECAEQMMPGVNRNDVMIVIKQD